MNFVVEIQYPLESFSLLSYEYMIVIIAAGIFSITYFVLVTSLKKRKAELKKEINLRIKIELNKVYSYHKKNHQELLAIFSEYENNLTTMEFFDKLVLNELDEHKKLLDDKKIRLRQLEKISKKINMLSNYRASEIQKLREPANL